MIVRKDVRIFRQQLIQSDLDPFCPLEWEGVAHGESLLSELFLEKLDPGSRWMSQNGHGDWMDWLLSAVASLPDFQRLMRIAAQRTARLLDQAEIARDAGLALSGEPILGSGWNRPLPRPSWPGKGLIRFAVGSVAGEPVESVRGVVLYGGSEARPLGNNLSALPYAALFPAPSKGKRVDTAVNTAEFP